jgi:Lrp/AsnC family transcriptional regulator for asnA, asnC and gidA
MDEKNRAIISLLQYDGRMPYTEIANRVGITEGSVRRRVKQLIEKGKLQIVGIVEPQHIGWNEAGMIGVNVQPNKIEAVANQIAKFPEVSYLFMASGEFDLFVEVYCKDKEQFVNFLNQKLMQIHGVEKIQSHMILKMYKLSYRWGEAEYPADPQLELPLDKSE